MNYQDSVRELMALGKELAAPRQARVQKFGLGNITTLCEDLGNPQRKTPCVHIAGTNGKGSTAAMVESILRAAGLRTGLYTSPHLESINERIRIGGENISDAKFAAAWSRVRTSIERLMAAGILAAHPTYFECLTAMAFLTFEEEGADFAVYEVGLGGRLDATNVVTPEVAVITPIDFDHEDYLGHSIAEIAAEKAGIIKPGAWVASAATRAEARDMIRRRCAEMDARLVETESVWQVAGIQALNGCYRATISAPKSARKIQLELPLAGRFQMQNAITAATAARLLATRGFPIDDDAIAQGIAVVRWPGRLERVLEHPDVYLDGTHNPSGARELLQFWEENFRGRAIVLVYGAMRDKAVDEIAGLLFPRARAVILTEPRQPRAISAALLAEMTAHLAGKISVVPDPAEALERAIHSAAEDEAIFATGSLYLTGDLHSYMSKRNQRKQPAGAAAMAARPSIFS